MDLQEKNNNNNTKKGENLSPINSKNNYKRALKIHIINSATCEKIPTYLINVIYKK